MGSFRAVHKDYVRKASKILFFFPAKDTRIVWLDLNDMALIQIVAGDQLLSFFGLSIHVENNLAATRCQSELYRFGITHWLAYTHQLLTHVFVCNNLSYCFILNCQFLILTLSCNKNRKIGHSVV